MESYPLLAAHLPLILTDPPLISYHSFQKGNSSVMWLVMGVGECALKGRQFMHSLSQTAVQRSVKTMKTIVALSSNRA